MGNLEVTADSRLKMNIADIKAVFARKFMNSTTTAKLN
ncbi:hypothetical protein PR003_g12944 [Phytophthora rubi]|uniref:Uncharacterized protein n=1 Tax=Phytophthora rubi TaxID=129364 RepID=A0A6A4F736_9STRA|nr:hypothetical protein PR003_g12944 [Phytophthora rubi]